MNQQNYDRAGKQQAAGVREERRRILFYGHVQGVGFRYQARRYAAAFGLKGWVRNEYDGSVCMEIQGDPERIRQVLRMIREDRYIRIDRFETETIPTEAGEGFHVRF